MYRPRRFGRSYASRPKRNVIKRIFVLNKTPTTTQADQTLFTVPTGTACVLSGMRIQGQESLGNTSSDVQSAISFQRNGVTGPILGLIDGSTIEPAQDVLWLRTVNAASTGIDVTPFDAPVRVKRRMNEGDQIIFQTISSTSSAQLTYTVTLWFHT